MFAYTSGASGIFFTRRSKIGALLETFDLRIVPLSSFVLPLTILLFESVGVKCINYMIASVHTSSNANIANELFDYGAAEELWWSSGVEFCHRVLLSGTSYQS